MKGKIVKIVFKHFLILCINAQYNPLPTYTHIIENFC